MSALTQKFADLKQKGEKALVLFVTAGDPGLDQLPGILDALQDGGADVIEIGIPFSDPIADGPTIQASSQRALDRGVTPRDALMTLARCQLNLPVVLMGYYNPALKMGLDTFCAEARKAGCSGTIMCDLIPEESVDWIAASRKADMDTIFLAAPTSTEARLVSICESASGFVYAISRTGVTGSATQESDGARSLVSQIRTQSSLPVCVGFGVSTHDHVADVCSYADGAVVGSWLVDFLYNNWKNGEGRAELVSKVRELKRATISKS